MNWIAFLAVLAIPLTLMLLLWLLSVWVEWTVKTETTDYFGRPAYIYTPWKVTFNWCAVVLLVAVVFGLAA